MPLLGFLRQDPLPKSIRLSPARHLVSHDLPAYLATSFSRAGPQRPRQQRTRAQLALREQLLVTSSMREQSYKLSNDSKFRQRYREATQNKESFYLSTQKFDTSLSFLRENRPADPKRFKHTSLFYPDATRLSTINPLRTLSRVKNQRQRIKSQVVQRECDRQFSRAGRAKLIQFRDYGKERVWGRGTMAWLQRQ